MAMRKVCDELGLRYGRCRDDAKAVLKEKGKSLPSSVQLKKVIDKIEEEHYVIIFLYKTDKSQYGKVIEQKENDVLQCNDPFPEIGTDACRILSGWKTNTAIATQD